ncbi:TonB-dependent receptor [Flavobacterium jejuense]|uniref:TonB-dependent receptor n=1 Tax=Flavobacterium jejuense TaxID=1544455 RepID=A0ABX0INP2_9FLAO|nr:TonB-dependent receptor [Flavobacterium jejuense]NHN25298.1 TonB-dependent receptor [Flavobacterium jejuense]
MRTFMFLFCTVIFASTPNIVLSQSVKIKIKIDKEVSVDEIFDMISKQTKYAFIYQDDLFKNHPKLQLKKGVVYMDALINQILVNGQLDVVLTTNDIIIIKKANSNQQIKVTGKVTDDSGYPLPGVTIKVKGTKLGAVTNFDGGYSINVPNLENVLVFSYLGHKSIEIVVGNQTKIDVQMQATISNLEEVVIVGYGKSKRQDLAGFVGVIKTEDINTNSDPTVESQLAGKLSGVLVTRRDGRPGGGASIQVRGLSSLLGSNEPLYVIDGIPYQPNFNDSNNDVNILSFINPADIESVSVLKDASSAAIYGSRAANGVVLITTKKGSLGNKPEFEIDYKTTIQVPKFNIKYLNAEQWLGVVAEAYSNAGEDINGPGSTFTNLGGSTDWVDESLSTSLMNTLNLGVKGTSEKNNYNASLSYTDQGGIVQPSFFKRYNARLNQESKITDNFKIGTNLTYSYSERDAGPNFNLIARQRPDMPRYFINPGDVNSVNYLARAEKTKRLSKSNVILGSLYGELEIIKDLKIKSAFNISRIITKNFTFSPAELDISNVARRSDSNIENTALVWDNTLNYAKRFNETHNIDVLAGASWNRNTNIFEYINSTGFSNEDFLFNLGSADQIQGYSSNKIVSGLGSYFIRSNYSYRDKYYLTFTGRADKSTKFGPNNRWGYFPSVGLAWDISKEKFMQDKTINYLKLKSSVGVTGLASFGDFLFKTFYEPGSYYNGSNGIATSGIPNPNLRWEKTTQLDVGIDFGLFHNKINGSLGYYSKYTNDLILQVPIPLESGGGTTQIQNVGDLNNRGIEFSINANIIDNKDFKWNASFNITYQKNTVEKLGDGIISNFNNTLYLEEGQPLGIFRGYKSAGIFQTQAEIDELNTNAPDGVYQFADTKPGDVKIVDVNGDGEINQFDLTTIGNAIPNFYGGFNSLLTYKKFEISTYFQYQLGSEMIPRLVTDAQKVKANSLFGNYTTGVLNAWTPTNTDTDQPRNFKSDATYNLETVDTDVSNASYLKLKNIRIGYNINALKDVKTVIYLSATDLFTITKYKGSDPEVTEFDDGGTNNYNFGNDSGRYPYSRTFSFGVNFKF